jgi:hypothetical protein
VAATGAVGDDEGCAGRDDEVPWGGEDEPEVSVEAAAEVRRDGEGVLSCEIAKFLERFIRWGSGDLGEGIWEPFCVFFDGCHCDGLGGSNLMAVDCRSL